MSAQAFIEKLHLHCSEAESCQIIMIVVEQQSAIRCTKVVAGIDDDNGTASKSGLIKEVSRVRAPVLHRRQSKSTGTSTYCIIPLLASWVG